jgi:sugar/nucleoside kinase (ribokinase family)
MIQAVQEANVAASLAVEREGPAEGPWLDELKSLLEQALPMARLRKCGESEDS